MPSAWSKLYLRDEAPQFDPGTSELSSVLPVAADVADAAEDPKSLSPYTGMAVANTGLASVATTNHQDCFFTSFSSPPLLAGEYGGGTWAYAISCSEANTVANSFFVFSVYIYRPSTASIVGFIYDSDSPLGTEWPTAQGGRGATFTGVGVTAVNGDILVLEVWRHAAQDKGASHNQVIYYGGTVDVANGDTVADAASWIQAPHEIGFKPRLRGVGVN